MTSSESSSADTLNLATIVVQPYVLRSTESIWCYDNFYYDTEKIYYASSVTFKTIAAINDKAHKSLI